MELSPELMEKYNRPVPRYTSYPTAVEFHEGVTSETYVQKLEEASASTAPWSVYMHLPFCWERCLFCACHAIATKNQEISKRYLEDLYGEMALVSGHIGKRRGVSQLHLGGGTPTFYSPDSLRALVERFQEYFHLEEGAELSIEVDPRVTTEGHISTLADLGFNRISLGVQDTDAVVQQAVHRMLPFEKIKALFDICRKYGFQSINVDLMYGLPHQTMESLNESLDQVISLGPDRLAVYAFAYVPWMKKHQERLKDEALPSPALRFELRKLVRQKFLDAGYVDIGMDHFARPTDILTLAQQNGTLTRNFMGYITKAAPDCLGFGVSSIGYVAGAFFQNLKKLSRYGEQIKEGKAPVERGYVLTQDDLIRQRVIMQLMCNLTLSMEEIEQQFDISFPAYFALELEQLNEFVEQGLLEVTPKRIQVLPQGAWLIRNISSVFDRHLRERSSQKPAFSKAV